MADVLWRARSYANDIVWRVPFRGRPADGGDRAWLHLVLMIEVQGEVDHLMALRVRNYVDNHHLELWRGRRFGAVDRLAPVLPIVIYTGPSRWTAALWVIDLVTPGASDGVAADVSSRASRLFSGDGYLTVDTMRLPATICGVTTRRRCSRGCATQRWSTCRPRRRRCGRG